MMDYIQSKFILNIDFQLIPFDKHMALVLAIAGSATMYE